VFNHQLSILEERLRAQKQDEAFRTIERSIKHWRRKRIARSFNRWRDVLESESNQKNIVKKMFGRWEHRLTCIAFLTWRQNVEEGQHHEITMKRFLETVMNVQLARAMHKWKYEVQRASELKMFVSRSVLRWRRASLSRALRSWITAVNRMKYGNQDRDNRLLLKKTTMEKVFARVRFKSLSRGLNKWRDCLRIDDLKTRVQRTLRRVVKHWIRKKLSKGFSKWSTLIRNIRSEDEQKMRMKRVILHAAHRRLVHAWNTWVVFSIRTTQIDESQALTRMRAASTIDRIVKHWIRAVMSKAFTKWCDVLKQEDHGKAVLKRVVSRLQNKHLAAAMDRWKYICMHKKIEQARQKEMINAVERTVKRILNRALYSSFTTWKGHVHLIKDRQRSARRLVRISRSLSLSLSLVIQEPRFE